jgi:hypothetical protein
MPRQSFYSQNRNEQNFQLSSEMRKRHEFSDTEVGITHPDISSFIRLNDDGDIEIFAEPGVGLIINGTSRSITFFADTIRFHTKDDGLRWNNYAFNSSSTTYIEPTLVKINMDKIHPAIYDVSYYLDKVKQIEDQEKSQPITIRGDFTFSQGENELSNTLNFIDSIPTLNLSEEEINLINHYSLSNDTSRVDRLLELINSGATFSQAKQRVVEEFQ